MQSTINGNQITLGCNSVVTLSDLDTAKISYVPCNSEQPLLKYASLHGKRQHIGKAAYGKKWNAYTTRNMTGVQLMCGKPTFKRIGRTGYLYYTSLDIERRMIEKFPDEVAQIRKLYEDNLTGIPCILTTKSDGLRLDAYTEYVGKKMSFRDETGEMLFEVLADKCLARIDHRYTMLSGSLLEMPTLSKEALQEIHGIICEVATTETADDKPREVVEWSQIKDLDIEWGSNGRSQLFPTQYCQRTDHRSNRDEVRFTKHSDGSIDGKCFNCGETWWEILPKQNGYEPTQRKRYSINSEYKHTTSDIDTERNENKSVLENWLEGTEDENGKHLLILGSAAGTAKTTLTVTTPEAVLYIAKTTEEADKVFEKLDAEEEDVIRHRPRMFNQGHKDLKNVPDWKTLPLGLGENERPCIHPESCNLLAERGHAPTLFCVTACPVYEKCLNMGYLSQVAKEQKTLKVIYAWNEVIACDETHNALVKRICAAEDILIVDEVNPLGLTQARKLNRDTLYDLTERFRHPYENTVSIYEELKELLDIISIAETPESFIQGVHEWIENVKDLEGLDKKINSYPVGIVISKTPAHRTHEQSFEASITYQNKDVTVPVVDFDTADDTPALHVAPETPIKTDKYQVRFMPFSFLLKVGLATFDDPPRKHRKLLADMKTFLDENANLQNAPFTFDAKRQTFDFHLKPTLNHRRVIFNTASDPDNLIGEAYSETDVNITRHTGTPTVWKTDLVFQISSGAYLPRHSLIGKNGKELYVKKRAQEFVDGFIRPSITAGLKTLVVAPKAFQKVESIAEWAVTEMEDYQPGRNAMLINHHHAEGRNDYQDFDLVFVFHYEPNHHEIQNAAKRIYRNAQTPLKFTREKRPVKVGGVSFEKSVYVDERVQVVYNRECRQRKMQSAMRLRPNIHEGKIVVFLSAEPVDIPVTPIPFHPDNAEHFMGNWKDFKETLQASVEERIANGDSKSKAYRDTAAPRKKEKDALKQQVYQWNDDKVPIDEIASRVGKHRTTIERWIQDKPHTVQNSQSTISTSYNGLGKMHTPTPPVDMDVPADTPVDPPAYRNLFDWNFKEIDLRRDEIHHHKDVSALLKNLSADHPLLNFTDDEFLRIHYEDQKIAAVSLVYQNWREAQIQAGDNP